MQAVCEALGIRAKAVYGAPYNESFEDSDPWTVTLRYKRRRMTVPFYTGLGLRDRMRNGPSAADVLECLASDASLYENAETFEAFCAELGYDTDSRKAERSYKECGRIAERLRRFLGDDYDRVVYNRED